MKYSNLDILSGSTNHPNSTKVIKIEKSISDDFIVSVKYPNGIVGAIGLNNIELGLDLNTVEEVESYLKTMVEKPLLDIDPIGKMCMFINGYNQEIWGVCEGVDSFRYVVVKDKVKYYTNKLDIVDKNGQGTIIQLSKIGNKHHLTVNQNPTIPKLITKEKYDNLLATKNLRLVPFEDHLIKGLTYYSEI